MTTKDKIVLKAIELFNEQGFGPVFLIDIAKALDMSRGNIAYHFSDKGKLLMAITKRLKTDIDNKLQSKNAIPAFENFKIDISIYYEINQQYKFIFGNEDILQYDFVKTIVQNWANATIKGMKDAFAFGIQVGNVKPEAYKGIYENLAINLWMIIYFWHSQKFVRGDETIEDAEKMVWSAIIPHLTVKGNYTFQKHFGKEFINNLGEDFNNYSKRINIF